MENQIDRPVVRYGLAEIEYDIEVTSELASKNTSESIIDIVTKIVAAHNDNCALNLKVSWTLI